MAYTKHTWAQRLGVKLNRFKDLLTGSYLELVNEPTSVSQAGTPIRADWLNEMEQGIADAHTIGEGALPKTGGTMAGAIAMGGKQITGLADATGADHAMSRQAGDARYLGKAAKAADSELFDGLDSTDFVKQVGTAQRIGTSPKVIGTSLEGSCILQLMNNADARLGYIGYAQTNNSLLYIVDQQAVGMRLHSPGGITTFSGAFLNGVTFGTGAPPASGMPGQIYVQY